MTAISSMKCSPFAFSQKIPRKNCFSSYLQGLTVKAFDEIYDERERKYHKHKIQTLFQRKGRERKFPAGRPFKLDVKNRFLMLLVYHHLYITYTLTGFLFNLDQSNVCRAFKRINIVYGKKKYNPS
jgi:hypothetical protein